MVTACVYQRGRSLCAKISNLQAVTTAVMTQRVMQCPKTHLGENVEGWDGMWEEKHMHEGHLASVDPSALLLLSVVQGTWPWLFMDTLL